MSPQEYNKQNELGFEGDFILKETVEQICKDNNITWIIETGTYRGATTKHFANWADRVDTIEIVPENYNHAEGVLKDFQNVHRHLGSSDLILEDIFKSYNKKGRRPNLLLFLDAHWQEHNPLLNELDLIAKYNWKPIIIIHDFKVPSHPELGFDQYGDITYEWDWIKDKIESIYGKEYKVNYNSEAAGAKRGVIIISK